MFNPPSHPFYHLGDLYYDLSKVDYTYVFTLLNIFVDLSSFKNEKKVPCLPLKQYCPECYNILINLINTHTGKKKERL